MMKKKKYTPRNLSVLIEDQNKKMDAMYEYVKDVPGIKDYISQLNEKMVRVENNIELIKMSLKRKVDLEEFEAPEQRVMILERKV